MTIGPFLRREMTTSVRGARAFLDRQWSALMAGVIVVGAALFCDYQGWDRSSVAGAGVFGLATFGMLVMGIGLVAFGLVVGQVAMSIAAERDRKTLDALLASGFTSAEVVLGAVAAGLFRYLDALAATVPIVVLMIYLGGVGPGWAILGGVAVGSTALLLAGLSVVASVGSRTAARAVVAASTWFSAWLALPALYVLLRPIAWPGAPPWLTSTIVAILEGGPMGLFMNLLGLLPGPGGPLGALGRMVAWQAVATAALVAYAVARLRPASRALYDVEGRRGVVRALKAALRRPPRRPSCSDDPVLWYEVHATRGVGRVRRMLRRAIGLGAYLALGAGIWYFARPAFVELLSRGYGASPEAFAMPELHPLLRALIKQRVASFPMDVLPGQARLELNVLLRILTGVYTMAFLLTCFSWSFESIKGERRRDTWLGLIATPLTGREILRGKALGSAWRARATGWTLVALWTVGLVAGAVHPLGYLASIAFLAVSAACFGTLGLAMALLECRAEAGEPATFRLIHLPLAMTGGLVSIAGPLALSWAGLLTYEDVASAIQAGPFIPVADQSAIGGIGARGVMLTWLVGTAALAYATVRLDRQNARRFDESVGRPVRARVER